MPDLGNTRRKLKVAIAAMVVADALAAGVLFSPLVGSAESRRMQLSQLSVELRKKTHDVEPLRNIDKKVVLAKNQINEFYKHRFCATDSELATELGKLAASNGIRIQSAHYKEEDPEASGIVPVAIDGSFSGDYLQLAKFINTLERSKMFITVDSVSLAGEGTGQVHLQISLHTYLRSGV